MDDKKPRVRFKSTQIKKNKSYKWVVVITNITFLMAIIFGYASLSFMEKVDLVLAIVILLLIVLIGVFFDALGIAVTAANETPFHSMAASKVPAAKESIMIIRNASVVANFFNDVIGDISGIISGTAAGAIVYKLTETINMADTTLNIILGAMAAAITVGGKALGKELALSNANLIVYNIGKAVYLFNNIVSLIKLKKEEKN